MSTQARIESAVEVIGRDEPQDYGLRLLDAADRYRSSAPAFASVLSDSSLVETARRFERQDAEAVEAQRLFRRVWSQVTWAVFGSSVAAAVLSALAILAPKLTAGSAQEDWPLWLKGTTLGLGVCVLIGGTWSAFASHNLNRGKLLERWMKGRARAEAQRLAYFTKLAQRTTEPDDDGTLALLALEFFRRYQVAVQHLYYGTRSRTHDSSHRRTIVLGALAAAILSLGAGVGGVTATLVPGALPLAALGMIGAAIATLSNRREAINQDERNAERYRRTYETLGHLRENHSEVQRAVATGNARVLPKYVAAVHEQLSLEHRQWLAEAEAIEPALADLKSELAALAVLPQALPGAG